MTETEAVRRAKALQFIKDCGFTSTECARCQKTVDSLNLGQLMRCARCRLAYYCSMKCVEAHFEEHREACLMGQKYGSFLPPAETSTETQSSSGLSRMKLRGARSFSGNDACNSDTQSMKPAKVPSKSSSFCVPSSSLGKAKSQGKSNKDDKTVENKGDEDGTVLKKPTKKPSMKRAKSVRKKKDKAEPTDKAMSDDETAKSTANAPTKPLKSSLKKSSFKQARPNIKDSIDADSSGTAKLATESGQGNDDVATNTNTCSTSVGTQPLKNSHESSEGQGKESVSEECPNNNKDDAALASALSQQQSLLNALLARQEEAEGKLAALEQQAQQLSMENKDLKDQLQQKNDDNTCTLNTNEAGPDSKDKPNSKLPKSILKRGKSADSAKKDSTVNSGKTPVRRNKSGEISAKSHKAVVPDASSDDNGEPSSKRSSHLRRHKSADDLEYGDNESQKSKPTKTKKERKPPKASKSESDALGGVVVKSEEDEIQDGIRKLMENKGKCCYCLKIIPKYRELSCARCKAAQYCSATCMDADFNLHRKICCFVAEFQDFASECPVAK